MASLLETLQRLDAVSKSQPFEESQL
jgi:hypothetical protein